MYRLNFITFFSLFVCLLFTTNKTFSQQVNKNYVVVEITTGTWCTYCPGAAMGADDLVENGHNVAIIENHGGDSYETPASASRTSFYKVQYYPSSLFNGGDMIEGGSHSASLYPSFLPKYNTAIAVMSDFSMDLSYTNTDLDYDVTIEIDEPGDYSGTNLVVHLVLTESHIEESWQGMTELNFVNRAMYPDYNGTAFSGGTQSINLSFTANAGWDLQNCELVAFIQDKGTKEILQADKVFLANPSGTNNVEVVSIGDISDLCNGAITPKIKVKNHGSTDITSLTIDFSINSGATTGTFDWSGDAIPFNNYAEFELDEVLFSLLSTNTLELTISQVNGNTDDDITNNTANTDFDKAPEGTNIVNMTLNTDAYGDECTWDVRSSSGTILYSGGPYANNRTFNETFYLDLDCNVFNIYDSYGDGGGSITIDDSEGTVFFYTNGTYGGGVAQLFRTVSTVLPEVSFNPTDGATNIDFSSDVIITFNQPMRNFDDSEILNGDINNFITITYPTKEDITFSATINSEKTEITITPDAVFPENEDITVSIVNNVVETAYDDALASTAITFTTAAYPLSNVAFNPTNGSVNVPVETNISLTFDNPMKFIGGNEILNGDISSFVTLTSPTKGDIAYACSINQDKTIISLDPNESLPILTDITVTIAENVIENEFEKALPSAYSTFTTYDNTGVSELLNNVIVFPNPAENIVFISNAKNSTVTITEISGRLLLSQFVDSNSEEIDITNLNSGLYIVSITLNNYRSEKKLIVVK